MNRASNRAFAAAALAAALPVFALMQTPPAAGQGAPKSSLAPHVHGEGHMDIAYEKGRLTIDLDVPGDDIVGFEHQPSTPQERTALENALKRLRDPLDLFRLDGAANCKVGSASADWDVDVAPAGAGGAQSGSHAAIEAKYEIVCANPAGLKRMTFQFFAVFSKAQSLDIQFVSAKGQTAATVSRAKPVFEFGNRI